MRSMIGCVGMISAAAFVFGAAGSFFAAEATLLERSMMAAMTAAMAFFAAVLLFVRDRVRYAVALQRVRRRLIARDDVSYRDFATRFPHLDATLVVQTRLAVAAFFGVPASKVHPADRLRADLQFDVLGPSFHLFVVYYVLAARNAAPQPFHFHNRKLADLGDLVKEVQRVLAGIARGAVKRNADQ